MRPPPSRSGLTSAVSMRTGTPVRTSADLICAGVQLGCRWRRTATAPATWGADMLVPLTSPKVRPGNDDRTSVPGAVTSGLKRSEYGVGPAEEKSAGASVSTLPCPPVEAPAEIALAAFAGDVIVPIPNSAKSLPAATVETT